MEQTELHETRVTPYQLFLTFSWITLSGFGGVMFWARRKLVEIYGSVRDPATLLETTR